MKDFQQHFLASFPYSVHTVAGKKGDKSEKNEQVRTAKAFNSRLGGYNCAYFLSFGV